MFRSPGNREDKLARLTSSSVHQHRSGRQRRRQARNASGSASNRGARGSAAEHRGQDDDLVSQPVEQLADQHEELGTHADWQSSVELERGSLSADRVPETSSGNPQAEGQRWDSLRRTLQEEYVCSLVQNTELLQMRKDSLRSTVEAAVRTAAQECPSCPDADGQMLSNVRTVSVLWVGSTFRFELQVPISVCHHCSQHFGVVPLRAGCFPSTPVYSWDLTRTPNDVRPIWFDLSLIKVCLLDQCVLTHL